MNILHPLKRAGLNLDVRFLPPFPPNNACLSKPRHTHKGIEAGYWHWVKGSFFTSGSMPLLRVSRRRLPHCKGASISSCSPHRKPFSFPFSMVFSFLDFRSMVWCVQFWAKSHGSLVPENNFVICIIWNQRVDDTICECWKLSRHDSLAWVKSIFSPGFCPFSTKARAKYAHRTSGGGSH